MDDKLKSNITSSKHWLRFLFMLLFALLLQVATAIMWVLVILQFLFALITGKDNAKLRAFGSSLCIYIYESLQFLTYNREDKPFPFADWPEPEIVAEDDEPVMQNDQPVQQADKPLQQADEPVSQAGGEQRDTEATEAKAPNPAPARDPGAQ
ncbi:DUF4389 domain-containing protein [Exilibacterium tricleocarpae]|uniref:DUF4389 domain-containing protein n=1 Tax=Exilibacterium tricleocarpae TaxID=2591008 RepID=A0A545SRZ1_9GAMM|nr:DUF4389 domain-containing protein [Exilibacterium tricleocarpae]TQV67676.1 DUF4389 domain-containing protein [Exilibacterium tricleocarpae]